MIQRMLRSACITDPKQSCHCSIYLWWYYDICCGTSHCQCHSKPQHTYKLTYMLQPHCFSSPCSWCFLLWGEYLHLLWVELIGRSIDFCGFCKNLTTHHPVPPPPSPLLLLLSCVLQQNFTTLILATQSVDVSVWILPCGSAPYPSPFL